MNAKVLFALAIVAGLVAVFLMRSHVENLRGETIVVFKSAADMEAGELLGTGIEEVEIPAGFFPSLLEDAPTSEFVDFVQNTELRESVKAGELLLFRHFDASVDEGLVPDIPPGKKAISLAVDEESAVSFFIRPGDLVDVLGTFLGSDQSGGPQQNQDLFDVSTRPIVQAARVLAVGDNYRRSDRQTREPYGSVTLLVDMEEAAKLIFARDFFGVKITLVLRGENDTEVDEVLPEVGVDTMNFDNIGNRPATQEAP